MHSEEACRFRRRLPIWGDHLDDFRSPPGGEFCPSSTDPPLSPGALQPGTSSLADHLALELREAADHMRHHPTGRDRRVDGLGEGLEARPMMRSGWKARAFVMSSGAAPSA